MNIPDYLPQHFPLGIENELDAGVKLDLMGQHVGNEIAKCNNYWKNQVKVAVATTILQAAAVGGFILISGVIAYNLFF